jgi:exopolysaccharide biosynthesis polyprenyl glycosylphosphotransferase
VSLVSFVSFLVCHCRDVGANAASAHVLSLTIITALLLVLACVSGAVLRRSARGTHVLVIGTTPLARKVIGEIAARRHGDTVLAGVVGDADSVPLESPLDRLTVGPLDELDAIIDKVRPDRIVIAVADRRGRLPMRKLLDARLKGIAIEDGLHFYECLSGKVAIEALTPDGLISASGFRKSCLDLALGHALSLVVSAVAVVALAPLFAAVALAIKLDSCGPVFFVHDRVGLHGRRVRLLKFRTMHPARQTPSEWVGDNDARVTRVGKWLRRYHLDELPQLVNILRGEMNLVGPRPHPVRNFDLFMEKIPYYPLRVLVRPGLTGWAQVRQGYANGLDEEIEKMRYDLYYIKHMSAWMDLRILFDTVVTVLLGRGPADAGIGPQRPLTSTAGRSRPLIASTSTIAPQ